MTESREDWDAQLLFPKILPDFNAWIEHFGQRSQTAFESTDLSRTSGLYGTDERQWFEFFSKEQSPDWVPVYIHGGYWRAQKAEDYRSIVLNLAQRFGCAANLEYRLIPSVRMDSVVADVRSGLKALIEQLPDTARLVPIGHSAGGHLAIHALKDSMIASRVGGIISVSGVFDLAPVAHSSLQDELNLSEQEIERYSLIGQHFLESTPFVALVGQKETAVYHQQAQQFVQENRGSYAQILDCHHLSILSQLERQESPLMSALDHFTRSAEFPAVIPSISNQLDSL